MNGIWDPTTADLLLIKESAYNKILIKQHYQLDREYSVLTLDYENNKASVALMKQCLTNILKIIKESSVTNIYVADAGYFKQLTGETLSKSLGEIKPGIKEFTGYKIYPGINYQAIFHDPTNQNKLDTSMEVWNTRNFKTDLVETSVYPYGDTHSIKWLLSHMVNSERLSVDIETFSLDFKTAGIGTIAFSIIEIAHAIAVDSNKEDTNSLLYAMEVRNLLREFFSNYKGKLIFHNANFDVKVLIYNLYMKNDLDYEGLLEGLEVFYRNFEDTKVMAYLCYNSTNRPDLSLKTLTQDFMGNYGIDVNDINKIPLPDLLEYNGKDTIATLLLYKKLVPLLKKEEQEDIYNNIFKPSIKVITQMELVGLPMVSERIESSKQKMETILNKHLKVINKSTLIKDFNWQQQIKNFIQTNRKLKKKVKDIDECKVIFNPNSGKQIQEFLYDYMKLVVIDTTDTGLPATGADTLKKLINKIKVEYEL